MAGVFCFVFCFLYAPHWDISIARRTGGSFEPLVTSETTGPILKIYTAFESPGKSVEGNINDLGVMSDVTGQVKVKMFGISSE